MPYIIYADIESLIKKTDGYVNNPEKSSTTKIGEHLPYGYSVSAIREFDHSKDKLYVMENIIDIEKKCYF